MPKISRLVIDQQFAQVGIKITPAQMQITMPRPKMKIENELPQMELDIERPTFEINMQKVRDESGLKNPMTLMREIRDNAEVNVSQYIVETVNNGDFMGSTEQRGNRIAQISRQKGLEQATTEVNFGLMPQSVPEVTWDKGSININWSNQNFNIEWEGEFTPEIVIDPRYSVEVFLRNRSSIVITVEEEDLTSTARHIDTTL